MAKAKKTASKKKRARRASAASVAAAAPLSYEEASAMVRVARPKRAAHRAAAPEALTLDTIGAQRQRLEAQQRADIDERIDEYAAIMALMKQRGAAEPARARGRSARVIAAPLQILAEGDSWFDYPVPFFGGGVIPRLAERLGIPILNLAKAGDEVRFMLGVEQRRKLSERLTAGSPAGGPWDVLLFSGGGNDIVDDPMTLWIKDYDASVPAAQNINQARFDVALALVRAGYEDLIALRDRLSPSTQLFFHAYDFAIPDGRGICHHGPWLKPTFDSRGFPDRKAGSAVIRAMLEQFAAVLQSLSQEHPGVTLINGQGLLKPTVAAWHNELHPTQRGFDQFANLFHQTLKAAFPARVF